MKVRPLILALWLPLVFVCAQRAGAADSDAATSKAMAELFAQNDPVAADDARRAVIDAAGGDIAKLKAAVAADTAYEKLAAGWTTKRTQVTGREGKKYDLEYFVRVPEGYDAKKSWPVLLVFHGQGGNGELAGKVMGHYLGRHAEECILVAPTQAGTAAFYDASPHQEQSALAALAYVRTHMNVDDDRIYLTGYSLGGHQTWHLATMHERLWAAAVPMAGIPWFEGSPYTSELYLGNLAHLPLWAIWGELDRKVPGTPGNVDLCRDAQKRLKAIKNTTFVGTEIAGGGHGACWPKLEEFRKFIGGKKRALPTEFEHVFHMPHHARAYWLEATAYTAKPMDLSQPIQVRVTSKDLKEAETAIFQQLKRRMMHLSGKCDRAINTVTVKGTGIRAARLYVIDGMLDLSKPVTINFFGRTWKGKIAASPECLLAHYAATRDQTQLIVNEVELDSGGKVKVKFPMGEERGAKGEK